MLIASPNGEFVAGMNFINARIWNTSSLEVLQELQNADAIAFSEDSQFMAVAYGRLTSEVTIYDTQTWVNVEQFTVPLIVQELKWQDDRLYVLSNSFSLITEGNVYVASTLIAYDTVQSEIIFETAAQQYAAENELVLSISEDGTPLIWHQETGDVYLNRQLYLELPSYTEFDNEIVNFKVNEKLVATRRRSGKLEIWNIQMGEVVEQIVSESKITDFDWLDNDTLITLSEDHVVRFQEISLN